MIIVRFMEQEVAVQIFSNLYSFISHPQDPSLVIDAIVNNITYATPALVNPVGWQGHVVRWVVRLLGYEQLGQ